MTENQLSTREVIASTWQGDDLQNRQDEGSTRMMFHNIRHLSLTGASGLEEFIHAQVSTKIDLLCFSEHCLDTTKHQVMTTARQIMRSTYQGQALIQLHSSAEPAMNLYKPGGVGIQILGNLSSRLFPQGRGGDAMGRWSYVSIRRRLFPPVTVVSVYQVCPRPTNQIGNTAYHQQERTLLSSGRSIHPRQAFMQDLQSFVGTLIAQGHDVIIGGDFNASLQDKDSGVLQLASRYHLIDPFLNKYPNHQEFGTHETGRKRIDLVLVTRGVLPCITGIGYAPFEFFVHSDHRPLVLEFDTALFLGQQLFPTLTNTSRILKSKDKTTVKKYITTLYNHLNSHQAFAFQAKLDNDTATPDEVEALDSLIGDSENLAEQGCRRRRLEYYSKPLVLQRFKVSILRRHLLSLQKAQDRTTQLAKKLEHAGIDMRLPATKALTKRSLHRERERLQEMRTKSFELRQAELAQRINELNPSRQKSQHKAISMIRKIEANLKTYRTLQAMKKTGDTFTTLDRVDIPRSWPPVTQQASRHDLEDPKTCTEWKTETEPSAVEHYLLLRNRLHFGQAEGTPFTTSPLKLDIDWLANSSMANEVLQGTYDYQGDVSQLQNLLQECRSVAPLESIATTITMDEFRSKIKTWRESTTTSPSGRHLGRYKALFVRLPVHSDETSLEDPLAFSEKQDLIAHLKLGIINYCLRNTYVLTRWRKVVNVMIMKEPGNYKIHRLRVIHLYEADYNALCAIHWRKLLRFADTHQLINDGQYGGRPGCEAQSLTLLEELKYDISYMSRRSLFNFDNDATSCYDRIIVSMASMINRKYGMSRYVVALHASTLQCAQYYLKTANGISERSYSHQTDFPIHGTGQGSGNSPCIWLFISSTLYDAHARVSQGAFFSSPDGTCTLRLSMVGFVDDATGSCNDFRPQEQISLPQLFNRMTTDAQIWNDLLYCSGGKLELEKCSFHLLHFEFQPNGQPTPSLAHYDGAIKIVDAESGVSIPIPSKRAIEVHKTLGHYKAPVNAKPDVSTLQKIANRVATLIAMSPISRQGARLAYQTVFLPTVKYTLPQSFYSKTTLDSAQAIPHSKLVAKCGFNRNTARAIIYAPSQYAGGGMVPWHALQGEGQITQFLKHWRTGTIVSKALRIAVSWAQWQTGYRKSILEDAHTPIPHLECRWLRSLREFLATINGQIIITQSFVPAPERQRDIYIMDYAVSCGLFTNEELKVVNYCRLYLHVITVSELLEANGTDVIQSLYNCQREPWFDTSMYVTLQRRPSQHQIKSKWQRLCRQWFTSQGKLAMSIQIGKWTQPGQALRRRRQAYQETNAPYHVYYWRQSCYWKYEYDTQQHTYKPTGPTTWIPNRPCIPVSVRGPVSSLSLEKRKSQRLPVPKSIPIQRTFEQFVQTLAPWQKHVLTGITFNFGPYEIIHNLQTNNDNSPPIIVSDGSQRAENITYAWVFGSGDGRIFATHSGYGFGTPTSHRAEAWGALSAAVFIQQLLHYVYDGRDNYHPPRIDCFLDNSGLITRLTTRAKYEVVYPNSTLEPDWDIVEQIHATGQAVHPVVLEYGWVRGHQDESAEELPVEAKYNILADHMASQVRVPHYLKTTHSPWVLPSEQCQLRIRHRSIHGHYTSEIRTAYTLPPLFRYLRQRHNWLHDTYKMIDWQAFTQAARNTSISPTQLTKLVFEKLPTRYELSKSNRHQPPNCPTCSSVETFSHLLQCSSDLSTKFRNDLQTDLEKYLSAKGFDERVPGIVWSIIFPALFPDRTEERLISPITPDWQTILNAQQQIGFHLAPKGYLTTHLRRCLTKYLPTMEDGAAQRALDITVGIIHLLWTKQMELWKSYQTAQHSNSTPLNRIHERHQECIMRIRMLHERQHLCLAAHRDKYFYPNVEEFLDSANINQMTSYLHSYEPCILQSIKEATQITTRPLTAFPGFVIHQTRHQPIPVSKNTQPPDRGHFHHKHSRWKSSSHMRSLRTYFIDRDPPPDPP